MVLCWLAAGFCMVLYVCVFFLSSILITSLGEEGAGRSTGCLLMCTRVVVLQFEPRHDKTNKVTVRPAKTQISLGIRPV